MGTEHGNGFVLTNTKPIIPSEKLIQSVHHYSLVMRLTTVYNYHEHTGSFSLLQESELWIE